MADESSRAVPDGLRNGRTLAAVFAGLSLLAAAVVVLVLGGNLDHLLWALVAGVATAGSLVATYTLGRRYGQPHSHAFAQTGIVFGVLLLAAVIAQLLYSAGQLSNGMIGFGLGGAVVATLAIIGLIAVLDRATTA